MSMRGSVVPGGGGGVGVPEPGGGGGDSSPPPLLDGGGGAWLPPPPPPPPPLSGGGGPITGLPDGSQVTSGGIGVHCTSWPAPRPSTRPEPCAVRDAFALPL